MCDDIMHDQEWENFSVPFRNPGMVLTEKDIFGYFEVISAAFRVHLDREAIRHGLWKDYPAADQGNQIKVKIDRVQRSLERIGGDSVISNRELSEAQVEAMRTNAIEEAYDIINYAVFMVRKLQREQF